MRSHGGDDLVCVAGPTSGGGVVVDAGAGDDVVDTLATAVASVKVTLGSGADSFYGRPTWDDVSTSGHDGITFARIPDTERDVVDTGAGFDRVASLSDGTVNTVVITTGPDSDYLYVEGPLAAEGRLDGGTGGAHLETPVDAGALVVGAAADKAAGGPDKDRCAAEVEKSCEH